MSGFAGEKYSGARKIIMSLAIIGEKRGLNSIGRRLNHLDCLKGDDRALKGVGAIEWRSRDVTLPR